MKRIVTIPNILSFIRILMIPAIVVIYFSSVKNHYIWSALLVLLSGLTDMVDGFIARRFNMISDVGKILDPIADKLTQFTVVVCLSINHPILIPVVAVIFLKELFMLIGAVIFVHRGNETPYARWWGKMTTVVLYATMTLFMISDIIAISDAVTVTAMSISIACLAFSFYNYLAVFVNGRKAKSDAEDASAQERTEK